MADQATPTRRPDGKPETAAEERFFDLRESRGRRIRRDAPRFPALKDTTMSNPARLAVRHFCEHKDSAGVWSGIHTARNGKPRSKRCAYCGGSLITVTGLWGVFEWRGDGRYRPSDAVRTFTVEARAGACVKSQRAARYPAGLVVRWIPDGSLDTAPAVKRTPECAGGEHYRCPRRPGYDPALDHGGYCACECHGAAPGLAGVA